LAYLFGGSLTSVARIAAVATALGIGWISRRAHLRFRHDHLASFFAGMFGLGVAIYSAIRTSGPTCSASCSATCWGSGWDLIGLAVLGGIVLVVIWAFWKEFLFATSTLGAGGRG